MNSSVGRSGLCALVVGLLVVVLSPLAKAQTNDEANASLRFNFSNPGARSLGMGGAFAALADDSTAAYANPAGIAGLRRAEITLEGRLTSSADQFVYGGGQTAPADALHLDALCPDGTRRDDLDPSGCTFQLGDRGDTVSGLLLSDADSSNDIGAGFISYLRPFHDRFAVAVYRHELASLDQTFLSEGAFFWECLSRDAAGNCIGGEYLRSRHRPVESSTQMEIVNYGFSFAVEFGKRFSIGLGASYYTLDLESQSNRFQLANKWDTDLDFTTLNLSSSTTQVGSDEAFAANVGLLWRITKKVSAGLVYRQGPSFDMTASTRVLNRLKPGAAFPVDYRDHFTEPGDLPGVSTPGAIDPTADINEEIFNVNFKVPDVWALGFAFQPTKNLTVSAEYNYIDYTSLGDLTDLFQVLEQDGGVNKFKADAVSVYRLGLEYVFESIAIRAGAWMDPDHEVRYEGLNDDRQVHFRAGDDQVHGSLGLGFALGKNWEFALAGDFSDSVQTGSILGIYRFGGGANTSGPEEAVEAVEGEK